MTKIDVQPLLNQLNGLAEVFDKKPITPKALEVWFDTLKEFPTEKVLGLLIVWPKSHNKFPAPSEVWKVCNDTAIATREKQANADKRDDMQWAKSPQGARFLEEMRKMLKQPARSPMEHWRHVLATQPKESVGYEWAKEILEKRRPGSVVEVERVPGEDVEEQVF